jgi:hypothetical protein
MGKPTGAEITLCDIRPAAGATLTLLGHGEVTWRQAGRDTVVTCPVIGDTPAFAITISKVAQ